jgi:iron complex outermembrane recepter protein
MSKQLFAAVVRVLRGPRGTFGLAARPAMFAALPMLVAALAVNALLSGPAHAAATTAGELQEVIVTAEKREATVQATPISLTALTAEDLAQRNLFKLDDLAATTPGVSMRTAGPGQTEYEMRGLSAGGGSAATVGFYFDEVPLSANAVALNGRTVIDPDLFDLNHVEVLRGPQGTLYGAGSMGGTIKLIPNAPKLGAFEGATDVNVSQTSHGSTNGGGSLMLNFPMGEKAALRLVLTDKYNSGFIDRIIIQPGAFPYPTNPSSGVIGAPPGPTPYLCVYYTYCTRGDVQSAPVAKVVHGSNLNRFVAGRATLLVKPSDALSVSTTLMYQRIDADGYNNYQQQSNPSDFYNPATGAQALPRYQQSQKLAIWQPYDQPEPYYDSFKMASMTITYNFGPATLTSATAYWKRYVFQSTDSTEALQNINNLTPQNGDQRTAFIQNLYSETDPTTQFSQEFRLTSNGEGRFQWQAGLYFADLHSGYITYNQEPGFASAASCGLPAASNPVGGQCPAAQQYNPNGVLRFPPFIDPATGMAAQYPPSVIGQPAPSNPLGVVFNDNNPNVMKQSAVFGEISYKLKEDLKASLGLRVFKFIIDNHADQAGLGTGSFNQDHTIQDQHLEGTSVLPRFNLSYTPTPDLTVYGTVAKGSRPGGVNLPIPLPTAEQIALNPGGYNCQAPPVAVHSQPSFLPDKVWSIELGEKAKLADRRFTINADIYYIKWTDLQQVFSLSCGYPYNTNAGNGKVYGPEVEMSWRATDEWTFDLSGTKPKAYISEPSANALATTYIGPGTRIINVPSFQATASVEYRRALTDTLTGMARVSEVLTGDLRDTAAYPQILPGYNIVDARFGVNAATWSAAIVGTNLTNKVAALTIDNTVFAWQTYAITRVSTNVPRTVGLDFQYKF